MKTEYFKLYSCCVPVMGKSGALIVNLQKVSYTTIPQFLCELLQEYDNVTIGTIEKMYGDEDNTIRQYLNYLCEQGLGFFTAEPQRYPKMDLDWDAPEVIRHAVLQIEDYGRFDYKDILRQLDDLLCKNMEIWFTGDYTKEQLEDLLSATQGSALRSLALVLPYNARLAGDYEKLIAKYTKTGQIYLHRAPETVKEPDKGVYAVQEDLGDFRKAFTDIPRDEYIIFLEFFTESQKHNAYYNRKVCIDAEGYIRNCLTHRRHFGNIGQRRLSELATDADFTELWYACNDRILDIMDSEFRYMWLNTHELQKADEYNYRMVES